MSSKLVSAWGSVLYCDPEVGGLPEFEEWCNNHPTLPISLSLGFHRSLFQFRVRPLTEECS